MFVKNWRFIIYRPLLPCSHSAGVGVSYASLHSVYSGFLLGEVRDNLRRRAHWAETHHQNAPAEPVVIRSPKAFRSWGAGIDLSLEDAELGACHDGRPLTPSIYASSFPRRSYIGRWGNGWPVAVFVWLACALTILGRGRETGPEN